MPSFSAQELGTALSEVSWGIKQFVVLPAQFAPAGESRAKLELLEDGDSAIVGVSEKGWKVCLRTVADHGRLPEDGAAKDDQTFETLDHLLAYLSPAFEKRRMATLSSRLEGIAMQQSEAAGEEESKEAAVGKVEKKGDKVDLEGGDVDVFD